MVVAGGLPETAGGMFPALPALQRIRVLAFCFTPGLPTSGTARPSPAAWGRPQGGAGGPLLGEPVGPSGGGGAASRPSSVPAALVTSRA